MRRPVDAASREGRMAAESVSPGTSWARVEMRCEGRPSSKRIWERSFSGWGQTTSVLRTEPRSPRRGSSGESGLREVSQSSAPEAMASMQRTARELVASSAKRAAVSVMGESGLLACGRNAKWMVRGRGEPTNCWAAAMMAATPVALASVPGLPGRLS